MLNRAPIASRRMAAPSYTLTLRRRWWVAPVLLVTLAALKLGAPIRAAHVERLAALIARHGFTVSSSRA